MWRRAVSSWLADTPTRVVTEIPTPRGLPFVGTTLDLIAAGSAPKLHEYVDARHRQLGPIYRESIGPMTSVFVSDPNEMRRVFSLEGKYPKHVLPESWKLYNEIYGYKRGLFFMDGEEWLEFRRTMNRLLLRPDSGQSLLQPCEIVANNLVAQWKKKYSGCEVKNLESELYRWSIDIMIAVLMGDTYLKHKQELENMVADFASIVHLIFETSVPLSLIPAKVAAFLNIAAWKNFVSTIDDAIRIANSLMAKLIPICQNGDGLMGAMLEEGIEHKDVVRIVADLVLAAGDTTSYATQWMLYLLANNSDIQEQLYAEVQAMHSSEDIVQMPLLRGVMRESLRLYPVAPFLTRYLPQDSLIGGYLIPAGELCCLSLYTSGRDDKNFPRSNEFWPERWTRNATAGNYNGVNNPYASLPFAMGARSCIGRKIAEVQITLTLAKVLQQFKLELIDKKPIDMKLRLVGVPSCPIRLCITER